MRSVQTPGSVQAQRARTSSACLAASVFGIGGTVAEGYSWGLSFMHSPSWAPLARRALPRFNATMGPLTPERPVLRTGRFLAGIRHMNAFPTSAQVSLLHVFGLPSIPSSTTAASPAVALTHNPSAWRVSVSGPGFANPPQARQTQRPKQVRYPTDCSFTSSCSPPPFTRTQLPSVTGRSVHA
jgi:hypothetical protein